MSDNIDTNVQNYTLDELMSITGITDMEPNEIISKTNVLINKYKVKNHKLAIFFQNIYYHFFETGEEDENEDDPKPINLKEKLYFNEILIKNNFYLDYLEGLDYYPEWDPPCQCNFFEVWKKIEI
jgi:hypothetical protein